MSSRVCRWGILGTANIARKNWAAICHAENSQLVAVASRSAEKAAQFIADCQSDSPVTPAPAALGSYEALLDHPEIDAVYIPLPTGLRLPWVLAAAKAGKHVLVEKPVAVHANQLREMLAACREHNVQFMDGVMYLHSRRMDALRAALDDPQNVGQVRRIMTQFSFCAPPEFLTDNIRSQDSLEPMGCLGDLGWYTIGFSLWVRHYELPTRVTARIHQAGGQGNVPLEFSAELQFGEGVTAGFYISFVTAHQQWAVISGNRGWIQLPDFVLPNYGSEVAFTINNADFAQNGCRFHMEDHPRRVAVREYSDGHPTAQETNLIRDFAALVLAGTPSTHWGEVSLKTQIVMDACLRSARAGGEEILIPQ